MYFCPVDSGTDFWDLNFRTIDARTILFSSRASNYGFVSFWGRKSLMDIVWFSKDGMRHKRPENYH